MLEPLLSLVGRGFVAASTVFYNPETRDFIRLRNNFLQTMIYDVQRLNRDAAWSDFYYTALEAEVEVDPGLELDTRTSIPIIAWIRLLGPMIRGVFRGVFRTSSAGKVERNLVKAIIRSRSRAFLIIGDPGSGKSVSLRHLFLRTAERAIKSNKKRATVPLYLNLKRFDVHKDDITAEEVHRWVENELKVGQDRTIHEFVSSHLDAMMERGTLLFLFDSFDEIPAVMDAQEDEETINLYAQAFGRFLYASHRCRGLVSSRPYRSPKTLVGQKMTIRPLSDNRIKEALDRYLIQDRGLAAQIWHELIRERDDLLHIARTPFYLDLLISYAQDQQRLPQRQYHLFEHFIDSRARIDEERLSHFELNPTQLIERASLLAFVMMQASQVGLTANEEQIRTALMPQVDWDGEIEDRTRQLLEALSYSKLGALAGNSEESTRSFSFAHRRFQEYLAARFLQDRPGAIPVQDLVADNRWREVLVLLCEVLDVEHLTPVFEVSHSTLKQGVEAEPGTQDHRAAVETLRFLKDGFRSRLQDLPSEIRALSSIFIQEQLTHDDLLDQKRAVESVALADDDSTALILESALGGDSDWLRETAIRSCRVLRSPSQPIAESIRAFFYNRYISFQLHRDFRFYSVVLSSPPSFAPLRTYLRILLASSIIQGAVYVGLISYGIAFGSRIAIAVLWSAVFTAVTLLLRTIPPSGPRSTLSSLLGTMAIGNRLPRLAGNPWFLLSAMAFLFTFLPLLLGEAPQGERIAFNIVLLSFILINISLDTLTGDYPEGLSNWLTLPARVLIRLWKTLARLAIRTAHLWRETAVFTGLLISIGGVSVGMTVSFEALIDNGFSASRLYDQHHFMLATTIVVLGYLFTVLLGMAAIGSLIIIMVGARLFFG